MRLYHAIAHWSAGPNAIEVGVEASAELKRTSCALAAQAIPLKQTGKATSLIYTSPIAYRLATQPHQATTIAAQVVTALRQASDDDQTLPQGITVQAVAGLIHFEVGDRAIAAWLEQCLTSMLPPQRLTLVPMVERERQILLQSAAVFEAHYAHARCCSLLRLAHHEKLIRLEKLEQAPFYWQFDSTMSPRWFIATDFVLNHHAARCLILRLFEAFDWISDPSAQRTTVAAMVRSAQTVSQAFQVFHRTHPLWQHENESALVLAQLGLLMATQRILYRLLTDGLHLAPAVEL